MGKDHQIGHSILIAWAVDLVVCRARSVDLHSSLKAAGSGPFQVTEELSLTHLEDHHRVKGRASLAVRGVCPCCESGSRPAWLGRLEAFDLLAEGHGQTQINGDGIL